MSYPSIVNILAERGIDAEAATEASLRDALWDAFSRDLGEAVSWLRSLVAEMAKGRNPVIRNEDPNAPLSRKVARLVGTDIARSIVCEKLGAEFGIPDLAIGFYNCHGVKVAASPKLLNMTAREQIMCQNGIIASADC